MVCSDDEFAEVLNGTGRGLAPTPDAHFPETRYASVGLDLDDVVAAANAVRISGPVLFYSCDFHALSFFR